MIIKQLDFLILTEIKIHDIFKVLNNNIGVWLILRNERHSLVLGRNKSETVE